MSDLPFGFGMSDPDRDRDRDPGRDRPDGNPGGPFGFGVLPGMGGPGGTGGFDVGALGQMLTQLGQMLSQSGSGNAGPVNYDVAKQMALQTLSTAGLPSAQQASAVADAVRLAELWLDDATTLPAGATQAVAWSPRDWVDKTLPVWRRLCDPIAERQGSSWLEALPAEARELSAPLLAMAGQMNGLAFGSRLGQAFAELGRDALTSSDLGLPLGPEATAALLPAAVEFFAGELGIKASEATVYLAVREAAYQRLFAHVPWLRQRLISTVEEFALGTRVDTERLAELAESIELSDPKSIEALMHSEALAPVATPEQKATLARLEALLALVEGWVDVVVTDAVGDRLPGAGALRETLRRRRATGTAAEQTLADVVGAQLRPRKLQAASAMWALLGERRGADGRDELWTHPDLLPTGTDLDDPDAFVDGLDKPKPPSDLDDPIAAIARIRERDQRADAARETTDNDTKNDTTGDDPPDDGEAGTAEGPSTSSS